MSKTAHTSIFLFLLLSGISRSQESSYRIAEGQLIFSEWQQELRAKFAEQVGKPDRYIYFILMRGNRESVFSFFGVREVFESVDPFSGKVAKLTGYETVLIEPGEPVRVKAAVRKEIEPMHLKAEIVTRNPIRGFVLGDFMIKRRGPDIYCFVMCRPQIDPSKDESLYGGIIVDPVEGSKCGDLYNLVIAGMKAMRK